MIKGILGCASVVLALGFVGCNKSTTANRPADEHTETVAQSGHNIDGWWCGEHGIPEEICAQCSVEVATKLKAAGDWCADHQLPDSQCFKCHPELAEKFAAQYKAKFGKEAPPIGG